MTTQTSLDAAAISAACLVIKQAGWGAMATQFRAEPEQRERIIKIVGRDIEKRFGAAMAERFTRNAAAAAR